MNAPVMFIPNLIAPDDAKVMFDRLATELDWERRDTAPRSEYYCNDTPAPYTYGRGAGVRTYEPKPWHTLITGVRNNIRSHFRRSCLGRMFSEYVQRFKRLVRVAR